MEDWTKPNQTVEVLCIVPFVPSPVPKEQRARQTRTHEPSFVFYDIKVAQNASIVDLFRALKRQAGYNSLPPEPEVYGWYKSTCVNSSNEAIMEPLEAASRVEDFKAIVVYDGALCDDVSEIWDHYYIPCGVDGSDRRLLIILRPQSVPVSSSSMSRHRNYSEIRSMFTALDPSRHPDLVAIDDSQFVKYVGFKEETMNEIVTDEQGVLIASSAVARLVDSTTKPDFAWVAQTDESSSCATHLPLVLKLGGSKFVVPVCYPLVGEKYSTHARTAYMIKYLMNKYTSSARKSFLIYDLNIMKKVMHSVLFPLLWRRLPGNREGGMALHGPPGNGKTVWLNLLRQFLVVIYKGGPDRYMDKYVGEAQERFRADAACSRMFGNRVSCIMIDEADSLLPDRNLSDEGHVRSMVNTFLSIVGNSVEYPELFVCLATNYMSQLDPAVRRPGRVGIHLYIGPLNREARWSLAKGRAPSSCLALEKHGASDFLSATKNFTAAQLDQLLTRMQTTASITNMDDHQRSEQVFRELTAYLKELRSRVASSSHNLAWNFASEPIPHFDGGTAHSIYSRQIINAIKPSCADNVLGRPTGRFLVSLVPGEEPFTEVEHYKPLIKHVLALEEHLGDSLIQEAVQLRAQRSCFPLLGVNSTDQGAYVQAIAPLVEHFDADSIVVINRATMEFDRTPAGSQSILLAEALSEKYHECTSINSPSVVVIFVDEILGTQGAVGLRNVTTSTQSKEAKRSRTTSSAYSRSAELSAQLAFTSASKSSISWQKSDSTKTDNSTSNRSLASKEDRAITGNNTRNSTTTNSGHDNKEGRTSSNNIQSVSAKNLDIQDITSKIKDEEIRQLKARSDEESNSKQRGINEERTRSTTLRTGNNRDDKLAHENANVEASGEQTRREIERAFAPEKQNWAVLLDFLRNTSFFNGGDPSNGPFVVLVCNNALTVQAIQMCADTWSTMPCSTNKVTSLEITNLEAQSPSLMVQLANCCPELKELTIRFISASKHSLDGLSILLKVLRIESLNFVFGGTAKMPECDVPIVLDDLGGPFTRIKQLHFENVAFNINAQARQWRYILYKVFPSLKRFSIASPLAHPKPSICQLSIAQVQRLDRIAVSDKELVAELKSPLIEEGSEAILYLETSTAVDALRIVSFGGRGDCELDNVMLRPRGASSDEGSRDRTYHAWIRTKVDRERPRVALKDVDKSLVQLFYVPTPTY